MERVLTVRGTQYEEMDAHIEPIGDGRIQVELEGPRGVRGAKVFADMPDKELELAIKQWIDDEWIHAHAHA